MSIDCKHPFIHAGTGRTDRLLKALMPSNVALDNREMADLMVFAARFGKVIKYWDTDNAPDGDWSCFWENDYLFFLATVAAANTEGAQKAFKTHELAFLDEQQKPVPTDSTRDKRGAALFTLVQTTRRLALDLATWGQKADAFPDLQKDITAIVRNTLRQPLRDLIAYAKELSENESNCKADYAAFISTQNRHPFAKEWDITQHEFDQNINFIDPRADYLAAWQDLKRIFRRFVIAQERVRQQAIKYLKLAQNDVNQRQHSPHITLFISFLHLFKHLQDQLNALPEKHLDYYYNDILHLQNRGEIPDHAHLVFQLALNVYQQTLPVGTLFRAGKTPDGKDKFYALERPLTLNQAQVVEIKTLLVQNTEGSLWENTVLDTDKNTPAPDKMKAVLPFRPLGESGKGKKVEVGFAISSTVFSKSKAYRTVVLNFKQNGTISDDIIKKLNANFNISITTKDVKKPLIIKQLGAKITVNGRCVDSQNQPLKDVKIVVKKFLIEVVSKPDGSFTIPNCPNNATLVFSLAGYDEHTQNVIGSPNLGDITMTKLAVLMLTAKTLAVIKVSGRCIDKKDASPLVGVSVVVKGTTNGTLTDLDGKFTLGDCPDNATLTFSFVGYETYEENVKERSNLEDVTMKKGSGQLDEVVVTGYSSRFNSPNFHISLSTDGRLSFRTTIPTKELPFDAPNNAKGNNNVFKAESPVLKAVLNSDSIDYDEVYKAFSKATLSAVNTIMYVSELTDFDLYEGSFTRPLGHTQNVDLTSALRAGGLIVRCDEAFKQGLKQLTINIYFKEPFQAVEVPKTKETGDAKNFAWVKSAKLFINGADTGKLGKIPPVKEIIDAKNNTIRIDFDYQFTAADKDGYVVIELKKNEVYTSLVQGLTIDPPTFVDVNIGYTINRDLDETEFFHLSSHGGHAAVNPNGSALMPPFPNPEPVFPKVEAAGSPKNSENTEGSSEAAIDDVQPRGGGLQAPNVVSPNALFRGNLFIGVKEPPKLGIVSLLFQVADGTEVDLDSFPPDIVWSYLSENDWKRFPSANVIFDSTKADEGSKRSLVQSGVIEFQMPDDAKKDDTLLNPAYYWLRASATETAAPIATTVGALPSLLGIYAQAGSVKLANSPIDARHFDAALAPSTINQLKFRQAAVKLIEQPYAGFGGRAVEQGATYHLRISERLRHKKRAITAWDYEHLVLEQFPEIRFVKCINHALPKVEILANGDKSVTLNARETGSVSVIVLPLKTTNPLRPQVNRATLENIKSYLKKYVNGFTAVDKMLEVVPPQYQAVVVSLSVKFHAGDTEKHVHNLDNDLAHFIAPWAFDGKIEPTFGETLHRTALLSQIEALEYVDYIEDFLIVGTDKINPIPDRFDKDKKVVLRKVTLKNSVAELTQPLSFIEPKDARTLLTSHQLDLQSPFEINHIITPL